MTPEAHSCTEVRRCRIHAHTLPHAHSFTEARRCRIHAHTLPHAHSYTEARGCRMHAPTFGFFVLVAIWKAGPTALPICPLPICPLPICPLAPCASPSPVLERGWPNEWYKSTTNPQVSGTKVLENLECHALIGAGLLL